MSGGGGPSRIVRSGPAVRVVSPAAGRSLVRTEARAEARRRHPAGRGWRPERGRMLQRLADRAYVGGAPWPRVAAAVMMLRGIAGDDPPTFARRVGVSSATLAGLEAGAEPASSVPGCLRALGGLVDWTWVEAGTRSDWGC
jgi:hypothetical protein